jgi:NAD(P)-dependent dehydrogenase (short-subunit alcohol dehydrogenase family)
VPRIRHALVQGASRGLGLELTRQLVERGVAVFATCREPERAPELQEVGPATVLRLDVEDERSVEAAAGRIGERTDTLDLVMNVAGLLQDGGLRPEKKLGDIDPGHLARLFAVNATGPLLVAKHVHPLLRHDRRAVLANISARVGSIEDNRLGGWYGYRASKAAQNMLTRTLAVELGRKAPNAIVMALHPGTVDTGLSKPFQRNVPDEKLFTVERAARQLLAIVDAATPPYHGTFRAWDDTVIPW